MAILTVHGCGFYALWLWEHNWLRGLIWDRNGTNMLAGEEGPPACPPAESAAACLCCVVELHFESRIDCIRLHSHQLRTTSARASQVQTVHMHLCRYTVLAERLCAVGHVYGVCPAQLL